MYKATNRSMRGTDLNPMKCRGSTSALLTAIVAIALLPMSISANAEDTVPPLIAGLMGWLVKCDEPIPEPDPSIVEAYDGVSGYDVYVEWVSDSRVEFPCGFYVLRIYSATDPSGNTAYMKHVLVVRDTEPPVVEPLPDIELGCGDSLPDPDPSLVQASDNCTEESDLFISWVGDSASIECGQMMTREYRVSDPCGNETSVIQTIKISHGKGGGGNGGGGKGGGKKK